MGEESRERKRRFCVHISEEEYLILTQKCEELEMTKSDYFRAMILFGYTHPDQVLEKKNADIIKAKLTDFYDVLCNIRYELNKIGININQLAHVANKNKVSDVQDYDYCKQVIVGFYEPIATAIDIAWDMKENFDAIREESLFGKKRKR